MTTYMTATVHTDTIPNPPRWIEHSDGRWSYTLDDSDTTIVYVNGTLADLRKWAELILHDIGAKS